MDNKYKCLVDKTSTSRIYVHKYKIILPKEKLFFVLHTLTYPNPLLP